MATGTLTHRVTGLGSAEEIAVSQTFSSFTSLEESISNGAAATQINVAIDQSAIKMLWISSDQALTFKTNSNSAPDDTISLLANVPYVWHATDYAALLITADVTAVHVINTSGTAATLKLKVGQDSTP